MASDRTPHVFPEFDSVEEERTHRKQRLAAAFRIFGHFGFDEGTAGHITARDPEFPDQFWVNPLGMNFKQIRVKDLLLVNHRGEVVDGTWPVNEAAFVIHSQIHAARPDVVSAAHSHSVFGKAWSSLKRPLDPLTQDACAFYDDHVVFGDYDGAVLDPDEGKRIACLQGHGSAVSVLQLWPGERGVLSGSRSVPSAVLIALPAEDDRGRCDAIAQVLRARGIATEVAATPQKYGKQIRSAERRGIPFVWFPASPDEAAGDEVKDIRSGAQGPADPANWTPPIDDLRPQVISQKDEM